MQQKFYAAYHKDKSIEKASSSGGAFTALTDQWFAYYAEEAVVYGCIMDENLLAKHIRADNREDRNKMRGSKYIGSDISGVFPAVERDINLGKYVVFSGTPCQIGGLQSFLKAKKIRYSRQLLTVEVICHGVGSVRFFQDYIHKMENRYKSKAIACTFRTKSQPGKKQDIAIWFSNGKRYNASSTRYDWFYSGYLGNFVLRPSCYQCKYASRERVADISIADHWADEQGEMVSRSLMIANTELGEEWIAAANRDMEMEMISWQQVHQPNMQKPSEKPLNYDAFWACYKQDGYLAAQKMLGNHTLKGYARSAVVSILYRLHLIVLVKYLRSKVKL